MFGPHLIIDGSRCDTRKLADRILVEQVLNDYPTAIGMTKIGGPYMFEYQAPDPAYSGVSGLVVIAESHIAIHTFPELDYFTMDIFSCKNFDHEKAIAYIKAAFDVQEMDRMLIQRGLAFKGPHHGKLGATDELIAAAEARLAMGIISKEPALPDEQLEDEQPKTASLANERASALARHAGQPEAHDGYMVWPQYGVTPDLGTYGAEAGEPGARMSAPHAAAEGVPVVAPVLVNPTASVSGLLDKMSASSGAGRALGRALAAWETLVREPETTIALALSTPVVAAGLREQLVWAIERGYVDVVIASAEDLFADLYQALGHEHLDDGAGPVLSAEGHEATRELVLRLLAELPTDEISTASELWRAIGLALPERAPRKGLLQAAAKVGVRVFTPDLTSGPFGGALLAARARGITLALDAPEDVVALGHLLAEQPRLGVIRVGIGAADALLAQARDALPLLALSAPTPSALITLEAPAGAVSARADAHAIALPVEASLALPLLVTALAQRLPDGRPRPQPVQPTFMQEPALA